jgi:hypothetical protein
MASFDLIQKEEGQAEPALPDISQPSDGADAGSAGK